MAIILTNIPSLSSIVFVPSFGDLFLMAIILTNIPSLSSIVFVPSFGDLFLICRWHARKSYRTLSGFRPLFWGFVFNAIEILEE